MNYDFLQNYNIPVVQQNTDDQYSSSYSTNMEGGYGTYSMQSAQNTPTVNTAYYGYGDCNAYNNSYDSAAPIPGNPFEYQNPERFMPPSKHGTGYIPRKPFKRKPNGGGGGSAPKKEIPIPEVADDGTLLIFLGRDETYPNELNSLIHPLTCDLCNVKMNSRMIAKDHYESKAHDKHISSWLFKNYTEKGVNPPTVKRFIKQGPTGPDAYYCEPCDLKLTSITHANQHYAGKKHSLVIAQRAKPSGTGFYNSEGKWIRTGRKATPKASKDQRFGIGNSFTVSDMLTRTGNINTVVELGSGVADTITSVADTTTTIDSEVKSTSKLTLTTNSDQDPALFCSICKVSVTSAVQMNMHLSGAKHIKKLKLSCGINPVVTSNNPESQTDVVPPPAIIDNVLFSAIKEEMKPDPTDLSMYRTPSGQYYCKICNISMSHLPGLEQHLKGKRHLKKQTEEKALLSLAAKKN